VRNLTCRTHISEIRQFLLPDMETCVNWAAGVTQ